MMLPVTTEMMHNSVSVIPSTVVHLCTLQTDHAVLNIDCTSK